MTAYGQSITPKWYQDTAPKQLTKYEFVQMLARALRAVGMLPIRQYWPVRRATSETPVYGRIDIDSIDLSTLPSTLWATTGHSWDHGLYFFDYPTSDTYVINNVSYRPGLAIVALESVQGTVGNLLGELVALVPFRRRADRIVMNDFVTAPRLAFPSTAGQNNFGFGLASDTKTRASATYMSGMDGGLIDLWNWKPTPTAGDGNHTALLSVKNFHLIMGKGGLLVQLGTGTGRLDSNDLMNIGFYFGGARVPNRARVSGLDPNLNRIDPLVMVPHLDVTVGADLLRREASATITNLVMTGTHPTAWALGIQHDLLVNVTLPTFMRLYNIENIERPFYPLYDIDTKGSPRLVSSVGAHILNRIVYMTFNSYLTSTYYGPIDPNLRIEPVPPWEDAWTFPSWRVADRGAPNGEFEDPVTTTNWWLYYVQNMNCMFAVEIEGMTKLAVLPTYAAPAQISDTLYSLASGFGAVTGATVQSVLLTGATNWVATTSTDEATLVTGTTSIQAALQFNVPVSADPISTCYRFSFQAYNKAPSGSGFSTNSAALFVEFSVDGGTTWLTAITTIQNAGPTTGDPAFNYATYVQDIEKNRTTDEIIFRFRFNRTGGSGTSTVAVKDVRIQRLQ